MPGIEGERVSIEDTRIGLLSYFQESSKSAWATHQDKHDLEDKALALAVAGVREALQLAVSSVKEDQTNLRDLLQARITALTEVVASNDQESRLRAEARRDQFRVDLEQWRNEHQRMHDVLREIENQREQDWVTGVQRIQLEKEGAHKELQEHFEKQLAQWRDEHQHMHGVLRETQEQRGQDWVRGLRELLDVKETAHAAIHADSQRAIDIADKSMTDKLGEMNQLRQQITFERGTYVNRDMLDARMATASESTTSLSKTNEARLSSLERSQNIAYGVMLVLVFAIPLGLKFIP